MLNSWRKNIYIAKVLNENLEDLLCQYIPLKFSRIINFFFHSFNKSFAANLTFLYLKCRYSENIRSQCVVNIVHEKNIAQKQKINHNISVLGTAGEWRRCPRVPPPPLTRCWGPGIYNRFIFRDGAVARSLRRRAPIYLYYNRRRRERDSKTVAFQKNTQSYKRLHGTVHLYRGDGTEAGPGVSCCRGGHIAAGSRH